MKMEVFHSTKVTHNFTASKKPIGGFFEALSRMCEDQTYTDLHLVAGDGQIFAAHQVCNESILYKNLSKLNSIQPASIAVYQSYKTLFICEGWNTHFTHAATCKRLSVYWFIAYR